MLGPLEIVAHDGEVLPLSGQKQRAVLALLLLTDARREARLDRTGRLLRLEEQDRRQWNAEAIREGLALLGQAINTGAPDRYALQAAIAAVHARAATWEDTDWDEVVRLYDALCDTWPSPVVSLNRAVAVGLARGPQAARSGEARPILFRLRRER